MNKLLITACLAAVLGVTSCTQPSPPDPKPPQTDTIDPTIKLSASSTAITAAGSVTLTATASDNVGVTKVEFYDNGLPLGTVTKAPYQWVVPYTAAQNGTHLLRAVVYDAAGNTSTSSVSVTVQITVQPSADTTPPSVSVSASTSSLTSAGEVKFTASAADNVGVSKVEFYDNGVLFATDTATPFEAVRSYTAADNGTHTIKVVAYDAAANQAESTTSVTVQITALADAQAPSVSLAVNPATLSAAGGVTLTAAASDNVAVTKVEFYDNGVLVGTDTTAPYGLRRAYTNADNGTHTLRAVAYDAAGNQAQAEQTLSVQLSAPDTTPPSLNLSVNQVNVTTAGDVKVSASASDNVAVTKVEFFDNGVLVATTTKPFETTRTYTAADNGTHILKAIAYDAAGNKTESTTSLNVQIVVTDTLPPTVSLDASTSKVTTTETVTFTAQANDNAAVIKVEFYDNDVLIGTDSAAPYQASRSYTSGSNGTHTIKAVAYDAAGNQAQQTTQIQVQLPTTTIPDTTPPSVSVTASQSNVSAAPSTVTFKATATDNVGVTRVDFFDNGVLLATAATAPFQATLTLSSSLQNGTHQVMAVAYDAAGNQATSTTQVKVSIP